MRVALITTAGLHYRDAPVFELADATFRPIDNDESSDNLVMSHSSVNFDKSGFAEDINVVFPIERFKELESRGEMAALRRPFQLYGSRPVTGSYEDTAARWPAYSSRSS